MFSRVRLIIGSAVFALAGLVSDQLAFQVSSEIDEAESSLRTFEQRNFSFSIGSRQAGRMRDALTISGFFDAGPSEQRQAFFSVLKQDYEKDQSTIEQLVAANNKIAKLAYEDEGKYFLPLVEELRPVMEEIKTNFEREISDWREQYYWSARYYDFEELLSIMVAGPIDVMESNQRYGIEALELKRQLLLTAAIGASLLSLFCLLLYVRSALRAYSAALYPKKMSGSGLYLKTAHFKKKRR